MKISIIFLNFQSRGHGRCTNELRTHVKYTHKRIGVDWWCPRTASRDQELETWIFGVFAFLCLAKLCALMHHGTLRVHVNFVEKSVFRGEGGRETHETLSRSSVIHLPTLQVDWRGLRESQVPPRFRNRNFHKKSRQIWSRRPTVLLQILLQNRKSKKCNSR